MKKLGTLLVASIVLALGACNDSGSNKRFLPPSTGPVNSLMVVMDTELWKGPVGDKIRDEFAAQIIGLPQIEPLFTITQLPPKVFKGTTTYSRSILYVEKDSTVLAHISTDAYSKPQKVAVITGPTEEIMIKNLDSLAPRAIKEFKAVELAEAQKRFSRSLSKDKALEEEFGITMNVPSLYKVGKREKNFVWMDIQIPKGTMNIIAYSMPWDSFENDSTFVQDIVRMRDSIGEKYIPGPYENTYMITEKAFAPYVFPAEIGGKKAAEVKGVWEIHGYPMAGPFLTYIINDKEHNRKMILEGFTFAPSTEKRDYMFELEAILKTVNFDPQAPAD
ncbi:DUF4837 family protein [Flagellimonas pelagia]|uniref:DUF4837 family protein n=1 Tax=Flagellimonas pelagia TaxID=2306998 RepID=A0A3A1NLR2_9FLAO|nr:DUF4837 family protein [Allomuricauda maritima]RIV44627.1 DUF4837 family protein [Allomuricauda maritima]TXJ94688.1 DUF4837 family protein [Allomuricauda maritima]